MRSDHGPDDFSLRWYVREGIDDLFVPRTVPYLTVHIVVVDGIEQVLSPETICCHVCFQAQHIQSAIVYIPVLIRLLAQPLLVVLGDLVRVQPVNKDVEYLRLKVVQYDSQFSTLFPTLFQRVTEVSGVVYKPSFVDSICRMLCADLDCNYFIGLGNCATRASVLAVFTNAACYLKRGGSGWVAVAVGLAL